MADPVSPCIRPRLPRHNCPGSTLISGDGASRTLRLRETGGTALVLRRGHCSGEQFADGNSDAVEGSRRDRLAGADFAKALIGAIRRLAVGKKPFIVHVDDPILGDAMPGVETQLGTLVECT